MNISTMITIPDSVYTFYQRAARQLECTTAQELMSQVLTTHAGISDKDMAEPAHADPQGL